MTDLNPRKARLRKFVSSDSAETLLERGYPGCSHTCLKERFVESLKHASLNMYTIPGIPHSDPCFV